MTRFEYARQAEIRAEILASANGGGWERWRPDADGEWWCRRPLDAGTRATILGVPSDEEYASAYDAYEADADRIAALDSQIIASQERLWNSQPGDSADAD